MASRDAFKAATTARHAISELLAYRDSIEGIRNWPFENTTLLRFTLYLLIPLGSWFGGAFVELGLDFLLD